MNKIVGLGIGGVVLLIVLSLFANLFFREQIKQHAEEEASEYATKGLLIAKAGVACVSQDSNGDGYVSCTVLDTAKGTAYPVECAGLFTFNSGCKLARNNIVAQ